MAQIRHMMQIRDMIVLKSNPSEYYTQTFTKKMIQELSLIRGFWFLESHPQTRDSQTVVGLSLLVFGSKSLINWLIFSSYHTSNIYIYIYG